MSVKPKILISSFIILLTIAFFSSFRSVPASKLWKGYEQLYVTSEEMTENDIISILKKNGCTDIVSRINQKLPFFSNISPIQVQTPDSFIVRRNGFFYDKNGKSMIFYVPENQTGALQKSLLEISAFNGTEAGTDGTVSFPWIPQILVCILLAVLFKFSKNKKLFATGSVFPVFFAFSRSAFTVAASSSFFIFAVFLFQKFWGRENFLKTVSNSVYFVLLIAAPFLLLIFSSPVNALFYLLCAASSAGCIYIFYEHESFQESKYTFKPVFIRSSRMLPVINRLNLKLMFFMAAIILISFVAFKFSGNISPLASTSSRLELPSPVSHSTELPNFNDLINWSWHTVTFPYKKLYSSQESWAEEPEEGETVSVSDYEEKNGRIVASEKTIYIFDNSFRNSVSKQIESLDYPAVEKMMIRQGKNSEFGYTKSSGSSAERFGTLLLIIFALIPLSLGLYYIWRRKRYGLSI